MTAGYVRVALGIAGICFQILAGAKLGRVDKKAHHQAFRLRAGKGHEVFVPLMVVAHGRHQSDIVSGAVPGLALGRQLLGICEYLHIKVL